MTNRFTDIHQHLLYGLDDGPDNRQKMYAMLRRAAKNAVVRIFATPHVTPGVRRFDREQYDRAMADARAYCQQEDLNIELCFGAEILYTDQTCRHLQEGRVPTLGDTNLVLVEFSPDVRFDRLKEAIKRLSYGGFSPVLAHAERYQCLVKRPGRAIKLKDELKLFYQVNCSTIIDPKGFFVRHFVQKMLKLRMIDAVASDAHNTSSRPLRMKKAWTVLKKRCGRAYARQLTDGSLLFDENS